MYKARLPADLGGAAGENGMQLSMWIIADRLRRFDPVVEIVSGKMEISGVRPLPGMRQMRDDILYVAPQDDGKVCSASTAPTGSAFARRGRKQCSTPCWTPSSIFSSGVTRFLPRSPAAEAFRKCWI